MDIKRKLYPYPVLISEADDYVKSTFGFHVRVEKGIRELKFQIEDLLDEGRYPIVKVKIGGNGASHWVVIMETWDKLYRCMDPLDNSGHLISLNDHESVAYRMRCVYWAD